MNKTKHRRLLIEKNIEKKTLKKYIENIIWFLILTHLAYIANG